MTKLFNYYFTFHPLIFTILIIDIAIKALCLTWQSVLHTHISLTKPNFI